MDRRVSPWEGRVWDAASEHLTAARSGNAGLSAAVPQPLSRVAARAHGPRGHAAAQVRAVMAFFRRSDHPSGRDLYSYPLPTTIAHFAPTISRDGALAVRCTVAPDIAPGGRISLDLLKNSRQMSELAHENARVRAPLHRGKAIMRCSGTLSTNPSRLTRPRQGDRMGLDRFAGMFTSKAPRPAAQVQAPYSAATRKVQKNGQHPSRDSSLD